MLYHSDEVNKNQKSKRNFFRSKVTGNTRELRTFPADETCSIFPDITFNCYILRASRGRCWRRSDAWNVFPIQSREISISTPVHADSNREGLLFWNPSSVLHVVVFSFSLHLSQHLCLSADDLTCWIHAEDRHLSEMRAVPTWIDKVHDRDKVEQW